jgi:8-hydroxy-5-deazaflavin:NADPH oxidoreductase
MKIGILGGGHVGSALGLSWTRKGHDVLFGVRNPSSPEISAVLAKSGGKARAGSAAEAAEFSNVVVNALPWPATKAVIASLNLSDKVLLDCANPFKPDLSALELGTTTSGGEQVAEWARGAKVVKIFNTTGYNNMENPVYGGAAVPMFYCGDDPAAKKTAAQLAGDTGFEPIDAGPLANARLLEPYALFWVWLAYRGGVGREFAFTLLKR